MSRAFTAVILLLLLARNDKLFDPPCILDFLFDLDYYSLFYVPRVAHPLDALITEAKHMIGTADLLVLPRF